MKGIEAVTSEGLRGPAYVRFSREPVNRTEPNSANEEVVVDYDAAGHIVGIELVSLSNETINTLLQIARLHDLDLSALLARPFAGPPAA